MTAPEFRPLQPEQRLFIANTRSKIQMMETLREDLENAGIPCPNFTTLINSDKKFTDDYEERAIAINKAAFESFSSTIIEHNDRYVITKEPPKLSWFERLIGKG